MEQEIKQEKNGKKKVYFKATVVAVQEIDAHLTGDALYEEISHIETQLRLDLDNMQEGGSSEYTYTSDVEESTREKLYEENYDLLTDLPGEDNTIHEMEPTDTQDLSRTPLQHTACLVYDEILLHAPGIRSFSPEDCLQADVMAAVKLVQQTGETPSHVVEALSEVSPFALKSGNSQNIKYWSTVLSQVGKRLGNEKKDSGYHR